MSVDNDMRVPFLLHANYNGLEIRNQHTYVTRYRRLPAYLNQTKLKKNNFETHSI